MLGTKAADGMNWDAHLERKHSVGAADLRHSPSLSRLAMPVRPAMPSTFVLMPET
jgi:hypothetical protein